MKKTILNLEGVEVLSKKEMRRVDGGVKCKSEPADGFYENDGAGSGTYNGGAVSGQCWVQCRPSFLGIGFGSWSEPELMPC
jgi:hypothetical protein